MSLGNWKDRIDETFAKEIRETGTYLGRSHYEKDCYWACYYYQEKYYIFLNDYYDCWQANAEDVENYLEVSPDGHPYLEA